MVKVLLKVAALGTISWPKPSVPPPVITSGLTIFAVAVAVAVAASAWAGIASAAAVAAAIMNRVRYWVIGLVSLLLAHRSPNKVTGLLTL